MSTKNGTKVLISDPISANGREILQKAGFTVDVKTGMTPEELKKIIAGYDALVVRSQTRVTQDIIDCATRLKVIGRAGVGVDNVDVPAATKKGIVVMNTPEGNTISTAEHTMSMLLAMARSIPQANAALKAGKWDRKKYTGVELYNKTLGIIGLGRIVGQVSTRARAFGMKVLVHDPFLSVEKAQQLDVEIADLDTIYRQADFITVHTPLTKDTEGMINKATFAKMKKGVRVINCARGGIIHEKDLADALKEGKVAGAALDVFSQEPPPKDLPLLAIDQVVVTPHLGAATEEAQENVAVDVAKQVVAALSGGFFRNAVNAPSIDSELLKILGPYLVLGQRLGMLVAQLIDGQVESIKITYRGEVTNTETGPITSSVLKGMLGKVLQEVVNDVNASIVAKERGIAVSETKSTNLQDFTDLVTVVVKTDKGPFSASGTLLGKKREPRIVKMQDNFVDAIPEGYLLIVFNRDIPGVIGQLGTTLGKHKINIAGMTVGRDAIGGEAITVVNVDSVVAKKVLAELKTLKNVIDTKMVEF
jgi:D-3-phosphoglycerate dehydrogenase / 2-oxoglutarate reductase